jgi:hypothetical protein
MADGSLSELLPMEIVSPRREQWRWMYNGAAFEIKNEITLQYDGARHDACTSKLAT